MPSLCLALALGLVSTSLFDRASVHGDSPTHPAVDYSFQNDADPYPAPAAAGDDHHWWKGNLHTHTFWSDGDQFPEVITQWYVANGYHFLALSDHNILSRGQRWFSARNNPGAVAIYKERFGEGWVETRGSGDNLDVRLKPLNEFRHLFERDGRFIMIEAEEITEGPHVVHVNATNIVELIRPQTGNTVEETIRLNIEAVVEQSERHGRAIMPHLNHPNFRWAVRAEDMIPIEDLKFFEVYNGHRGVANYGDDVRVDLERMWDIVLTKRLAEENLGIVYALAVDDAHNYESSSNNTARPGRGWVMIRSRFLTPEHLIAAMEAGDFYGSTGVTLKGITANERGLGVEVDPRPGEEYTIQFIGTRAGYDPSSEPVLVPKPAGKIADITDRWVFIQAVADRDAGEQILRVYDKENDQWHEAFIALDSGETNPSGPLHLPSRPQAYPFAGEMKEVRFWHRARTQAEAASDLDGALAGDEPGLAGYWPFDDASGDGTDDYAQVDHASGLTPGGNSFTIEMWVKTDPDAEGWNLPMEWPGADRVYVGQDVGAGWNFVVTTDGSRTDTQHGHSGEYEETRTTRRYSDDIGTILYEVQGTEAAYTFEGDEIYVRARVISSKEKEDPFAEGEREKAWVQPVRPLD